MTRARLLAAIGLALVAAPAAAVGLGPLVAEGQTLSDRKGFYLTLINPYPSRAQFRLYGVGYDDEQPQARVVILGDKAALPAASQRRVLIIAEDLQPGETYRFRVCAERADASEGTLHARVCSKLTARRVG